MEQLTKQDKEIYLGVFHDTLLMGNQLLAG
jgi:hypothetical protein